MVQELFISLASDFINERKPILSEDCPWDQLIQMASLQDLLPMLSYLNKQYSLCTDPQINEKLNTAFLRTVYLQGSREQRFIKLSQKLTELGIPHMPVKGWYLRELYPMPELRTYSDIDVLIQREDRERCDALLLAAGFTRGTDYEPTYSYSRGLESYELHTNLIDYDLDGREDMQGYFSHAWDHALLNNGCCFEPKTEFHFVFTAVHLAKHLYGGGAGLRMYMDLALFIKRYGANLNWTYVQGEMERLKLTAFFYTLLMALDHWFGTETPLAYTKTSLETLEELQEYTLDADIFGKMHDAYLARVRNEDGAFAGGRLSMLLRRIFPPAAVVEERYTFVAKHRWLLLVGWIARFFRNIRRVDQEVGKLQKIVSVNTDAVMEHDRFMKSVGL